MATRIEGSQQFTGDVKFLSTVDLPNGTVVDSDVSSSANIDPAKMRHRHAVSHGQADGSDVVSETKLLYVAKQAGTIQTIEIRPTTAPTGGDKQYTIDVQKAVNGSGTWASLLFAVVTVDSGEVDDTLITGVLIASPVLADGDAIRVVVTASGSTGTQGAGFVATINLDEAPS